MEKIKAASQIDWLIEKQGLQDMLFFEFEREQLSHTSKVIFFSDPDHQNIIKTIETPTMSKLRKFFKELNEDSNDNVF